MSNRGMSAAMVAELKKDRLHMVNLVEVHFSDETVYFTDAYKTIVWSGATYTALGHFVGADEIEETTELQISSMRAHLSGVDQTQVANVLAKNYLDYPLKIYRAMLDSDDAVIATPLLLFEGRMDAPTITENPDNGECTVSIEAANLFADFERRPGRHTNPHDQKAWFPGDLGFDNCSALIKDIKWGRT